MGSIDLSSVPGSFSGDYSVQMEFSLSEQPLSGFTIARSFPGDPGGPAPYAGFGWAFAMN